MKATTGAQKAPTVPGTATQGADARRTYSRVKTSVWTDRMLSALGNGVKGGKWFSLMDKVYAPKTLEVAWAKVLSTTAGSHFCRKPAVPIYIRRLCLLTLRYQYLLVGPYRHVR